MISQVLYAHQNFMQMSLYQLEVMHSAKVMHTLPLLFHLWWGIVLRRHYLYHKHMSVLVSSWKHQLFYKLLWRHAFTIRFLKMQKTSQLSPQLDSWIHEDWDNLKRSHYYKVFKIFRKIKRKRKGDGLTQSRNPQPSVCKTWALMLMRMFWRSLLHRGPDLDGSA